MSTLFEVPGFCPTTYGGPRQWNFEAEKVYWRKTDKSRFGDFKDVAPNIQVPLEFLRKRKDQYGAPMSSHLGPAVSYPHGWFSLDWLRTKEDLPDEIWA